MKKIFGLLVLLCGTGYSYTITHTDYTSGGTISASGQNTNENNIVNVINGNLDTTNIAANGVGTTQLTAQSVTAAKVANYSLGDNQMLPSGISKVSITSNTLTDNQISANALTHASIAASTIRGSTANSGGSAQELNQGTISTPDLRANAVTLSSAGVATGAFSKQTTLIDSVNLTTIGGKVLLMAMVSSQVTGTNIGLYDIDDGTTLFSVAESGGVTSTDYTINLMAIDSPAAGSHTYKLTWNNAGNTTLLAHNLIAIELRD